MTRVEREFKREFEKRKDSEWPHPFTAYLAGFKTALESDIETLNEVISGQRAGGMETGGAEICRNALIRKLDE